MPFRSVKDACRRLLNYHVFNSKTPTPDELMNADKQFETVSEHLLQKARKVFSTYRCLLLKESVRQHSSAEVLMLNKLFVEDEKTQLQNDKDDVKQGKELNLPPLPGHWIHKMDAVSEDSKMSVCVATTFASTCANTVTTTVHTAPLSSPSSKNKSRDNNNYDEWAEIQKELEMYDDDDVDDDDAPDTRQPETTVIKQEEHVMEADWDPVSRLSESEAAVESILMPLGSDNAENLTDIDEFEPSYAASDSGGGKTDEEEEEEEEDDEDDDDDDEEKLLSTPLAAGGEELNAQVESAINSILHLQQKEEFDEYMDGEYELEEDEKDKEADLGVVNEDASMEYDAGAAISLDTQEMDAALEEAVKSIM
uniref:GLTSCR protein conserved domain-containing protein n=1 Tax=Strigamia maritima TaxID=126957 RepID=T1IP13_STRMM